MKYTYNGEEFLKRLKAVSGITTQNELAEKIGVTQGTISKLKSDPPSGDTIVKIVANIGCSIDYLLGHNAEVTKGEKSITAPFIVDILDTLSEMDYIKLDSMEWEDYSCLHQATMKVNTAVVLIRNASLNTLIKNYAALKNALETVPANLEKDMFKLWTDSLKGYKFTDNSAADAECELKLYEAEHDY